MILQDEEHCTQANRNVGDPSDHIKNPHLLELQALGC